MQILLRLKGKAQNKTPATCRPMGVLVFAVLLTMTALCGCCLEYKEKPGLVLRGDWSVEMNRTKAIERTKELFMYEDEEDYSPHHRHHRLKKRKHGSKEHKSPCGRFGCLRCALGPSTVDEMLEQDIENDEGDENENPMMPDPKQFGKLYGQSMHQPGMMGYGMWVPGMMAPQGGIAMPPVPVINPNNGQQMIVQPAMPGQPGVMMLHAYSGQPIMVNPYAQPLAAPSGGLLAKGAPSIDGRLPTPPAPPTSGASQSEASSNGAAQNNAAQNTQQNPYANFRPFYGVPTPYGMMPYPAPQPFAQAPTAMRPPYPMPYGMQPYGMQPHLAPPYGTPMFAPMGIAAIDPNTGMIVPNPYAQQYPQQYPYGIPASALAQKQRDSDEDKDSPEQRTQMPNPKYHPVPSKPVFQRTEGLATNREAAEETRLKNLRLEKALGMKVPEGAKIADNGINQQIIQTSAVSRRNGGVPLVGVPFQSISGILGINNDESQPVKTAQGTTKAPQKTAKIQGDWLGIRSDSSPKQRFPEEGVIVHEGKAVVRSAPQTVEYHQAGDAEYEYEYEEENVPRSSSFPRIQNELQNEQDQLWEELFESTKGPANGLGSVSKQPARKPPAHRHVPKKTVAKNQETSITGKITSFFAPEKPAPKVCRPCPPPRRNMIAQNRPQPQQGSGQQFQENAPLLADAPVIITTDNYETEAFEDDESEDQLALESVELEPNEELPLLLAQKKRDTKTASPNKPAVFKREAADEIVQIQFQDEPKMDTKKPRLRQAAPEP